LDKEIMLAEPPAYVGPWFFSRVGMKRNTQAALATCGGVAGLLAGVIGLMVLASIGGASRPPGPEMGVALLVSIVGFSLGAVAFYSLEKSQWLAEIEACDEGTQLAAGVSIIAGILFLVCLALAVVVAVIAFFVVGAAVRSSSKD